MGGGVAALPAFNRDSLTNRPRIRLLDKASFILTLHIPQRLSGDGEGGGNFSGEWGREYRWHTVPGCALFDHA